VTDIVMRSGSAADAEALLALIDQHRREGHLLPRALGELRRCAGRFVVFEVDGAIQACAELAPLSASVAEVRSLVVSWDFRRVGVAAQLVNEVRRRAKAAGFDTLCAFTHDARFFVRQNFSIVPHLWLPEKIHADCSTCPLIRRCGQYAMVHSLEETRRQIPGAGHQRVAVA
jgi:amino-acid N-acetyltransferase